MEKIIRVADTNSPTRNDSRGIGGQGNENTKYRYSFESLVTKSSPVKIFVKMQIFGLPTLHVT